MVLKNLKLKENKYIQYLLYLLKKYYLIIIFLLSLFILIYFIAGMFFSNKKIIPIEKKEKKYIIISYNKILYTSDNIKNKNLLEGIKAYEDGYIEKAKFLFNAVIKSSSSNKKDKLIAYVNLANIFDDNDNYQTGIKYLLKALKINKKDYIVHHNLGILYKHNKDYKNAIIHFKEAIKYNKNFVKSYLSLASLYYYIKQYKKSAKYYDMALALNPDLYEAQYNLGIIYLKLHNFEKAFDYFEKLIKNSETPLKIKSIASKMIGTYYANAGDYEKALYYLNIAADYYESFDIYYKIGMIYKFKGEYEKALNFLKKAYMINNRNENTIKNLAELYYQFHDYDNALKYYNYLLKTYSNKGKIYLIVGEINYKNGYLNKAIESYLNAINSSLSEDEAKIAFVNLGNLYLLLNDYDNSLKYYKKALNLDNTDENIYYNITLLYIKEKLYDKALKYCKKALEINPDFQKINLLIPRIYLLKGDKRKATDFIKNLIDKSPENYSLYFELGNLYYSLHKYEKAIRYYKKIENIINDKEILFKIYLNEGVLYLKLKKYKKAEEYFQKANVIYENNGYLNYNLGLLKYNEKKFKEARKYLRKVTRLNVDNNLKALAYLAIGNSFYKEKRYKLALNAYDNALKYNNSLMEAYYNKKIILKRK